jgi:hypothetical protein
MGIALPPNAAAFFTSRLSEQHWVNFAFFYKGITPFGEPGATRDILSIPRIDSIPWFELQIP